MSELLIHTENLSFSYQGNEDEILPPALKNLSVDIPRGQYLAVLGHNGSGKSTFAKLLNLILEPTSGKLVVDGKDYTVGDISESDVLDLRKKIGMVFQNPDNQLVATLVEEDVAFGPENMGIPLPELRERIDNALKTVRMESFAGAEPHRLSGGQKQRVAIAGVIAMRPDCIIFDESTAMLDPAGRKDVMEMMRLLNREYGITVINITHYMNEAAEADRILVINDGTLLMDGTPDEVFSKRDELFAVGLEVPQCTEVIAQLRKLGVSLPGERISKSDDCIDILLKAYQK